MEIKEFIEKLADTLEIEDVSALNADTNFRDLDEWSSLSVLMLIAMFDEEYEKEIGDKDIKECTTIGDLYNLANA